MLKVYKASAGSGKTFTLAIEYIKLLIKNPDNYKYTLAVTFTNKATAEMKTRIMSQLYGIAHNLPSSNDYVEKLMDSEEVKKLGIDEKKMREIAGLALSNIVHDYTRFRIETIDSFFQSIIRELARELDLTANLKLDLSDKEALSDAVDTIIDKLETNNNTLQSVLNFIEEKMENSGSWRIDDELKTFGSNIFNEHYLIEGNELRNCISDPKFLKDYKEKITKYKSDTLKFFKNLGEKFIDSCKRNGYDSKSFKQCERGVYGFFHKMATIDDIPSENNYVKKCRGNAEEWTNNKSMYDVIESEYMPLLDKAVTAIDDAARIVNTVNTIYRHMNHLQLLNVIDETVRVLNEQNNRFLLADTAHFLRDIISGGDIPFIYEKTGSQFKYIMIDEFQDTSALQYENFKPLLEEALSKINPDDKCLIVGDVKQSIYRFRNSDWKILNGEVAKDFSTIISKETLDTNFRSAGNVITFNNNFFVKAKNIINSEYKKLHNMDCKDLIDAYSDVVQGIKNSNKDKGYVRVENIKVGAGSGPQSILPEELQQFVPEKYAGPDYGDYREATLSRMVGIVKELTAKGVSVNDITILIRFNKQIPVICQYFTDNYPEVDVVSDEAFRLDSSATINLIVLALKYIANPEEKFCVAHLAYTYQRNIMHNEKLDKDFDSVFLKTTEEIQELLPETLTKNVEKLSVTPIHELIEQLFNILKLDSIKDQDAYMFFFHDQLSKFIEDCKTDIDSFIKFWDESMCEQTIPSGSINGIRITSIHKSKGLEYQTVIIPYCDWSTSGKPSELLWCKPIDSPFNDLPLAPVNFNKTTQQSIFNSDYEEEVLRNWVDNLNLIYVAFTRAKSNLIILTGEDLKPKKAKKDSADKKADEKSKADNILSLIENSMPDFMVTDSQNSNSDITRFEYGTIVESQYEDEDKEKDNAISRKYSPEAVTFSHYKSCAEFKQSNNSTLFIKEEDSAEFEKRMEYINKGLLYHEILSHLRTARQEDIDKAIQTLNEQGCFDSQLQLENARKDITKAIQNNATAAEWFDEKWNVLNECNIIFKDNEGKVIEERPDRVITDGTETIVIDYKTGVPKKKHKEQVSSYIDRLNEMNYPNVHGFVWYILTDKICPVF